MVQLSIFITGIFMLLIGSILYYIYYDVKEEYNFFLFSKKKFVLVLAEVLITLSWLSILSYCFDIDGGERTTTLLDDMSWKNGIAMFLCILSLGYSCEKLLQMMKKQLK